VAVLVGLIVMSSSFYLWNLSTHPNPHNFTQKKAQPLPVKDLKPGSNKAMLVLADGSTILLDDSENGLLAMQGKTNIIKQQDGQITYKAGAANATEMVYNTLSTPRGGQFKISLPDGTKVWLNASTTLKYPVEFLGKERKVEISGEAYFEVAKDPSKPFLVETNQEMIEVLGTHFNVNNYGDEDLVKTTLLEGSINLKVDGGNSLLRPGQQAQLSKTGNLKVTNYVDLEEIIAWKEGNFQFEDETIKSIMRQIARWYDVDVEFRGQVNKRFGGVISRNVELSKVLNMLQMTGEVKLTIQGKKVIVEEP
jgi:ferric-dicitrate binding protein FerR (iron transport regulator)